MAPPTRIQSKPFPVRVRKRSNSLSTASSPKRPRINSDASTEDERMADNVRQPLLENHLVLESSHQDGSCQSSRSAPNQLTPEPLEMEPAHIYGCPSFAAVSRLASPTPPMSPPTISIETFENGSEICAGNPPDPSSPITNLRPFEWLPPKVVDLILGHVFTDREDSNDVTKPLFRSSMLAGYIRAGNQLRTNITTEVLQDNVDLRPMQVCKQFRDSGSKVFYGERTFSFSDPHLCKWWTKHIGNLNLSNIKSLSVDIRSGFQILRPSGYNVKSEDRYQMIDVDDRNCFDMSHEEQWYQFFAEFLSQHRLQEIFITLHKWKYICDTQDEQGDLTMRMLPAKTEREEREQDYQEETLHWRRMLIGKLERYRGLSKASIRDAGRGFLEPKDCHDFEMMMLQDRPPVISRGSSLWEHMLERERLEEERKKIPPRESAEK